MSNETLEGVLKVIAFSTVAVGALMFWARYLWGED